MIYNPLQYRLCDSLSVYYAFELKNSNMQYIECINASLKRYWIQYWIQY